MIKFVRILVLLSSFVFLPGCGIIDYFFLPKPEDTAQETFELARDAMQDKKYKEAAEYFAKVKDTYPFSPYAIEAELSLGDAYFLQKKYVEAAEAYKEFESLHPRHASIPYVLYQIGLSSMNQFISVDRPTTMVEQAMEYFNRVQQQFPDTEYSKKSAEQVHECRKRMAEHELYLGDMFWHMKKYGSAWRRYMYIVQTYPDVPEVSTHANEKASAAFHHYQKQLSETERRKLNSNWHEWFKWL